MKEICDILDAAAHLNFLEAGGDCAYSTLSFLPTRYYNKVVALDDRPAALKWWAARGFHTSESMLFDGIVMPTDEYTRARNAWSSALSPGATHFVHDKVKCFRRLTEAKPKMVWMPEEKWEKCVIRKAWSSGGKGTQIMESGGETLVTEHISGEELVVDVNGFTRRAYPRITHDIRAGRDTYATILGSRHDLYKHAVEAAFEVVDILGIKGVANVQLIAHRDGQSWPPMMFFVEVAMRLSGSSWLNSQVGDNPLLGLSAGAFVARHCTTQCGIEGWYGNH